MKKFLLISTFLLLVSCATPIQVHTVQTQLHITEPASPAQVNLAIPTWNVITKNDVNTIMDQQAKIQGTDNPVLIAVSPDDFQKIMLDFSSLERYIKDEQAITTYYQNAIDSAQSAVTTSNKTNK